MTNEQMNALYEGQKALCDLVKITSEPVYQRALRAMIDAIEYTERPMGTENEYVNLLIERYRDRDYAAKNRMTATDDKRTVREVQRDAVDSRPTISEVEDSFRGYKGG